MPFNPIEFANFLPAVLCAYVLLRHREQNIFLLANRRFFYPKWNWRFHIPLFFSTSTEARNHRHDRNIGFWCAKSTIMIAHTDEIGLSRGPSHDVGHAEEYRALTHGKS